MTVTAQSDLKNADAPVVTLAWMKEVCRKGGIKSADDPFWIMKYFYRPWTIYITFVCAKLGLRANGASVLSAVAVFCAAICYSIPSPGVWLAGAVLTQVYFVFDLVDGELGRLQARLGIDTGATGRFFDSICHAGSAAVFIAVALRQYTDLGQPYWLIPLIIVALFPGGINPWHRYCETLIVRARGRVREGTARLPEEFLFERSWTTLPKRRVKGGPASLLRRVSTAVIQLVGFPGYWCTIVVATLLDVISAAPRIVAGGQELPWLLIWLVVRAFHATLSSLKSTCVYARRLRSFKVNQAAPR